MSLEKKQILGLIGAGIIVLIILVIISVQSASGPSSDFELNKEGIVDFFVKNIDEVVPGENWQVNQIRFAESNRSYEGIYVEYEKEGRSQAFLMLVNPANDNIEYEIVGVFDIDEGGDLKIISGVDSFSGEDQEIWKITGESEWEILE